MRKTQEAALPEKPTNTVTKKVTRDLARRQPLYTQDAVTVDPENMEI